MNGNAQVAGHQFYTAGHGELMAGALGGQIKAVRSRLTPDSGQEGVSHLKDALASRVSAALKKRMHLIQFEKRTQ